MCIACCDGGSPACPTRSVWSGRRRPCSCARSTCPGLAALRLEERLGRVDEGSAGHLYRRRVVYTTMKSSSASWPLGLPVSHQNFVGMLSLLDDDLLFVASLFVVIGRPRHAILPAP